MLSTSSRRVEPEDRQIQRLAMKEREEFLEQSETALFEKMQSQQEKEIGIGAKEEISNRSPVTPAQRRAKGPMERALKELLAIRAFLFLFPLTPFPCH